MKGYESTPCLKKGGKSKLKKREHGTLRVQLIDPIMVAKLLVGDTQ